MLRYVVGALVANMMLVRCTSICQSNWRAPSHGAIVWNSASSQSRPWGTSKAYGQAGGGWWLNDSGHIRCGTIGTEIGILDPHTMQDYTDAARQRDHRALRSSAAGNPCGPCPEPPRTATMHHDRRGLAQGAPEIDVAGLGDSAQDIALARLISRRRQSNPGPDLLREREATGVVDRGLIGQCDHCADPGHGHHAASGRILLGKLADIAFQRNQLLSERQSRS